MHQILNVFTYFLYTLVQYITEQQVFNITDGSHFNNLAMTVLKK